MCSSDLMDVEINARNAAKFPRPFHGARSGLSEDVELASPLVASRGPAHWPDIHVPTPIDGNTHRFMTNQTAITATTVNNTFITHPLLYAKPSPVIIRLIGRNAQQHDSNCSRGKSVRLGERGLKGDKLAEQLVDHTAVHVGQTDIASAESERQPSMIDAQLVEDRGVNVMNRQFIFDHGIAEIIGFSERHAASESATG